MSSFKYDPSMMRIRAACLCAFNEVAETVKLLFEKDPTRDPGEDGQITWTERDSRRLEIDHDELSRMWENMMSNYEVCRADNVAPGCSFSLSGASWFRDQRERIAAILEHRAPNLSHWSFDKSASRILANMGITLVSPYTLSSDVLGRSEIVYTHEPDSTSIKFRKGEEDILVIPLENVVFTDISYAQNETTGEYSDVGILIHHTDGKLSYYKISDGRVTLREEHVDRISAR